MTSAQIKKCYIAALALLALGIFLVVVWFTVRPRDPLFHEKPESEWIAHLTYRDEDQVKQWREFGPNGVIVLVRALEGANRPKDRFYRNFYRGALRILPGRVVSHLPAPRMDLTRGTRMTVVDILSRLSPDAKPAIPAMTRALKDESDSVRQIAINFFTSGEDEHALLNQMEPAAKRDLLPLFIAAMQEDNWGVRNNALVALRYYPEQASVVVPVLLKALNDPVPQVRKLATNTFKRIDPTAAAKADLK
jgi:hypothetical protein